jgi:membrane fusion protein, macrolide-specific efflux system
VLKRLKFITKLPKKVLVPGIIIILALGWLLYPKSSTPIQLDTVKVEKHDIKAIISASGILTGKESSILKFRSGGKLAYLNVKVGDNVSAGQVIGGLDTQDLNISLQQAQNTYRDKQALAQKAEDDIKGHESDETYAQRATRTSAQAARDSAYDGVKAAQRAFQDAVIISPISGVVVDQASITPGQNISTSDIVATIVDFSQFEFSADVDEADISKIGLNQKAEVSFNAYGDQIFTGQVSKIAPQTKTSSSGATTINVRVTLDQNNLHPISGLSGNANIITSEASGVLTIPFESLGEDNQVVVKKGPSFEVVKVLTGVESESDIEIISGLSDGDIVLKNPSTYLASKKIAPNPIYRFFRTFSGGGRGGR